MDQSPNGLSVLIVDDEDDIRELNAECLRGSGYTVHQASNGVDALDQAMQIVPDFILLDLAMPNVDGWEVARRLQSDPRARSILVIALSGTTAPVEVKRALAAGCTAVLLKPCSPDLLLTELKLLRDRHLQGPSVRRDATA